MSVQNFGQTKAYQKAFALAMEIFQVSKTFPKEEMYSLTDQIRRSSRSVCICLAEAYRKKRYPAHFLAKLTDSDMENPETLGWLDFPWLAPTSLKRITKALPQGTKKSVAC